MSGVEGRPFSNKDLAPFAFDLPGAMHSEHTAIGPLAELDEIIQSSNLGQALKPNPKTEGKHWIRDTSGNIHHPLTLRLLKASSRMHLECQRKGIRDRHVHQMILQLQIAGVKVAGTLDSLAYDNEIEGGFAVASLKRSLIYLHHAITSLAKARRLVEIENEFIGDCEYSLFQLRSEILDVMNEFRKSP
jgi:hypothetical protein